VGRTEPGFRLRGTKGWAWTPEQYLAEIPFLVRVKMNFLMNCYTSLFADREKFVNRWWEPLPADTKRGFEAVVRACREKGLIFCFAVHPGLFTERPFRVDRGEDFAALWQHFAWMQGLGVRWFSLSYDDVAVEGLDKPALGQAHARLANTLLERLRDEDPEAQLIFCPVYYAGNGGAQEARLYLEALGRLLDEDVYIFWTGDDVVTSRITAACASAYRAVVKHRLIIWDNYPVNDRHPVLHLGPVSGRDPRLTEVAEGYMSNPLSPQNETNRLPLSTCADFAWNPWLYDPARSIGQAIFHLAERPAQREALRELVDLYPGGINCGDTRTSFDSVGDTFARLVAGPDGGRAAAAFLARLNGLAGRLDAEFPARFADARKTLRERIERLEAELRAAKVPGRTLSK
jgi:hyaluronoglucosaminidase